MKLSKSAAKMLLTILENTIYKLKTGHYMYSFCPFCQRQARHGPDGEPQAHKAALQQRQK